VLFPQHHCVLSLRTAQVWARPAVTVAHAVAVPTCTGVERSVMSPSPSWELALRPQHHRVPLSCVAQVWIRPAVTDDQPLAVPTWTGLLR
jgi:hypothetical protein